MKIKASEIEVGNIVIDNGVRFFISNIESDSVKITLWHFKGRLRFYKDDLVEVV